MVTTRFNLIPADRYERAHGVRVQRRWIVGGASYVAFLGVTFLVAQGVLLSDDNAVRDELGRLVKRVQLGEEQVKGIESELESVRDRITANRLIAGQPNWGILLAMLASALDEELVLSSCQVDQGAGEDGRSQSTGSSAHQAGLIHIELTGLGRTQQAVSQFVLRLEQHPLFSEVNLINTRREPFGGEFAVGFLIQCRLQATGGVEGPAT